MPICDLGDVKINWREDGDPAGAPVVLAHALGTDLRLWDAVIPLLPPALRLIRYDMRGHGASSVPPAPYTMGGLIRDAERLMDHLGATDAVFVGLSIGGLVAQGLAVKRLDLVRGLVLSNTAVKIGTQQMWQDRAAAVGAGGMGTVAEAQVARWFPPRFRPTPEARLWLDRLRATPPEGFAGACGAIGGADFLTPTSGLTLPTLVIAGGADGSTPPDLVRELAGVIRGARFALIRGAGHVPPVDKPAEWAALVARFLEEIAHA